MSKKLEDLRKLLKSNMIDGFIVPHADEYGEEIIAERDRRLKWLTGFTGEGGLALIFADNAFLLVDGRFTTQAKQEVNSKDFTVLEYTHKTPGQIICEEMKIAARMGYDPKLHSIMGTTELRKACEKAGAFPLSVKHNPIDSLWENRPAEPSSPVFLLEEKYCGTKAADKIALIAAALKKAKEDAVVLSSPQSICWLLNVRGSDVPFLPIVRSYAIAHAAGSVDWFIEPDRVGADLRKALGENVRILPPAIFVPEIERLAKKRKNIRLDPKQSSSWLENIIAIYGGKISLGPDPCSNLKAIKNDTEIAGIKNAHLKDGIALCKFLYWLETEGVGKTEYEAAQKLEEFKSEGELYQYPSFPSISATGENASLAHYTPAKTGSHKLKKDELYMIDCGSQYFDGTTDVTRTVCFAPPSPEHIARFTEVLKGHIALAGALFPKGTYGFELDSLARQFLWQTGHNYAHGTGHGVGFFLSVHEAPPTISLGRDSLPLAEGMIVTDEPAYYKDGAFGIRLENVLLVKKADIAGESEMLCFEPLTLVPFAKELIDFSALTQSEKKWLAAYHKRVYETLAPHLSPALKKWLKDKTEAP